MNRINVMKLVPTIFVGVGVLMLIIAGLLGLRSMSWSDATTTTGTVIAHHYEPPDEDDSGASWSFTVEWTDGQGETHQTHSGYSTNKPPEVGSQIEVQYYPDDPSRARVANWSGRWLATTVVGGMGAFFCLIAGIFLFLVRREPFLLPGPLQRPESTLPTDNYHGPVDPQSPPGSGWQQPAS